MGGAGEVKRAAADGSLQSALVLDFATAACGDAVESREGELDVRLVVISRTIWELLSGTNGLASGERWRRCWILAGDESSIVMYDAEDGDHGG